MSLIHTSIVEDMFGGRCIPHFMLSLSQLFFDLLNESISCLSSDCIDSTHESLPKQCPAADATLSVVSVKLQALKGDT